MGIILGCTGAAFSLMKLHTKNRAIKEAQYSVKIRKEYVVRELLYEFHQELQKIFSEGIISIQPLTNKDLFLNGYSELKSSKINLKLYSHQSKYQFQF